MIELFRPDLLVGTSANTLVNAFSLEGRISPSGVGSQGRLCRTSLGSFTLDRTKFSWTAQLCVRVVRTQVWERWANTAFELH